MVKHTVCFKLKEGESKEKAKEVLLSMKGNVKTVLDIFVGIDFLKSPRSYDVILQVIVKDELALQEYQQDEYHCSVVKKHMHAVTQTSVAIDCVI